MESIIIFLITIIVMAYQYIKKNNIKVLAKIKQMALKLITIILAGILILLIILEEAIQHLLNMIGKEIKVTKTRKQNLTRR